MWHKVRDSNPESVTGQRFSRPLDYQLSQPCVFRTLIQNRTELTANLLRVYIENYHCMSSKTVMVVILNIRKDFTMKLYNQAQSHKWFCRWARPAGGIYRTWTYNHPVMSRELWPIELISLMIPLSWHLAIFIPNPMESKWHVQLSWMVLDKPVFTWFVIIPDRWITQISLTFFLCIYALQGLTHYSTLLITAHIIILWFPLPVRSLQETTSNRLDFSCWYLRAMHS